MPFTQEMTDALKAGLDKAYVKERQQGGARLSYVEAWHCIAEANRIFGFDGWTRETVVLEETNRDLKEIQGRNGKYSQWRVGYLAKVRITAHGVVREGTGFGIGMGKPEALGDAIESAVKEAESDAMKRAIMTFGHPFGLALYDKTQSNVVDGPEATSPKPQAEPTPFDADKPDPIAEWANKNWTADRLDLRQMKLPPEKMLGGCITMVEHAPNIPDLNAFWKVNEAWLGSLDRTAFDQALGAAGKRRAFLSQDPKREAA